MIILYTGVGRLAALLSVLVVLWECRALALPLVQHMVLLQAIQFEAGTEALQGFHSSFKWLPTTSTFQPSTAAAYQLCIGMFPSWFTAPPPSLFPFPSENVSAEVREEEAWAANTISTVEGPDS
jgi:hypothetical protein